MAHTHTKQKNKHKTTLCTIITHAHTQKRSD